MDRCLVDNYTSIERGEQEIDAYIEHRAKQNRDKPRTEKEATWAASEQKHRARREAQLRNEWWQYHLGQAEKYLLGMQKDGRAA